MPNDGPQGWCWDLWVQSMRNHWRDENCGGLGRPALIRMLCVNNGWLLPGVGEVYTITEDGVQYEIRRKA